MNSAVVATLCVLFLYVHQASATGDSSCLNFTFSNILGLGKCLGPTADLCTSNSQAAVDLIGNLVLCALDGIGDLNVGSQLYLIFQGLLVTFERLNLGIGKDLISGLCGLLASLLGTTCSLTELDQTTLCDEPLDLNLPSVLGVGECFGTQLQVCDQGQLVTVGLVEILFNFILCMLGKLNDANLGSILGNIVCSMFNILNKILGTSFITTLLSGILGINC
ncbi:uncharacterized protein LOC120844544 isoform X2 [Ixodes scapularis]|nr:uncharacterized protein LOC120844544 isoform X2 [Ixodes scapularis]